MALHKTSSQSFIEQTKTDRGAPSATDEDSDQPSPTQDIDATEMDPSLDEEYMVMRSQSVDDDYVEVQLSNTPYENFTLPVSTVSTHTDGQVKAIQSEYIDIDQLESEYQQVAFTAQGSCNPAMEVGDINEHIVPSDNVQLLELPVSATSFIYVHSPYFT